MSFLTSLFPCNLYLHAYFKDSYSFFPQFFPSFISLLQFILPALLSLSLLSLTLIQSFINFKTSITKSNGNTRSDSSSSLKKTKRKKPPKNPCKKELCKFAFQHAKHASYVCTSLFTEIGSFHYTSIIAQHWSKTHILFSASQHFKSEIAAGEINPWQKKFENISRENTWGGEQRQYFRDRNTIGKL